MQKRKITVKDQADRMPTKDIAELFGVSIDTVRSWRCKSRLGTPRLAGNTVEDLRVFVNKNEQYKDRFLALFAPDSVRKELAK